MNRNFAVFIDGDNISSNDYLSALKKIKTRDNEIITKRVYGDWTTPNMKTWERILFNEPGTICHQFRSGKNAIDSRIIMDAIELAIRDEKINAYCIVSSDADFFGLAIRLREYGKYVIGIGKENSNPVWRESCNKFLTLDDIKRTEKGILLDTPKAFGLIKTKNDEIFHFCSSDIEGDKSEMTEGAEVSFKVLREPDPAHNDIKFQRGKAVNVKFMFSREACEENNRNEIWERVMYRS